MIRRIQVLGDSECRTTDRKSVAWGLSHELYYSQGYCCSRGSNPHTTWDDNFWRSAISSPLLLLSITSPLSSRPKSSPFNPRTFRHQNDEYLESRERQAGKLSHFTGRVPKSPGMLVPGLFSHWLTLCCSYWYGLVSMTDDWQLLVAILAVHSPLSFSAIAKAMGQGEYKVFIPKISSQSFPTSILSSHEPLYPTSLLNELIWWGIGDSSAAVKQHLYTLKARQEGTSAKSPTKDNTDKPTGRGRKSTTKTTAKRKTASVTQSEKGTVVESQDEHGDESASSPTKQRKI